MTADRDATTNELRHDWLADRWVIIAPQRTERPEDYIPRPPEIHDIADCPFCHGHEHKTPQAVAIYSARSNGNAHSWHVRVIPNKFPAVNAPAMSGKRTAPRVVEVPKAVMERTSGMSRKSAEELELQGSSPFVEESSGSIDLFQRRDLTGGHEVVVESPKHLQSFSELDRETVGLVFRAYRDRLNYWLNERNIAYAVVFKNEGLDAGASLSHSHAQIIATDVVPREISRVADRMRLFSQKESACLFCRMADDEMEQGIRVVEQTPDFVAFCPFASRLPSQITVVPKRHQSQFEQVSDFETDQLSWLTHRLVRRIEKCHPDSAYNFVIHTAPACSRNSIYFHWRLELFPRLTKVAGFEWGSDCFINPLSPEDAAAALRRAGV
jgi:UDPglucose--hexose-1-phosphate uridylyltransferase